MVLSFARAQPRVRARRISRQSSDTSSAPLVQLRPTRAARDATSSISLAWAWAVASVVVAMGWGWWFTLLL